MAVFIPNPIGIAAVPMSPGVVVVTGEVAEGIATVARTIAPVLTGAYRDSISASVGIEGGHALAHVSAGTDHAQYVEFGTSDTPTFAPLRRAAETYRL